jgi:hypothetical protein
MTVSVLVEDEPFDSQRSERTVIQLPWWDEEMASHFWPAVNSPVYTDCAVKTADLVNYVYHKAYQDGVRSILGRDS